eukprot:Colp12_sorted_trinity150504_noHs@2037
MAEEGRKRRPSCHELERPVSSVTSISEKDGKGHKRGHSLDFERTSMSKDEDQRSSLGDESLKGPPTKFATYLWKRRNWPLKGHHKRYFELYNGLIVYAKTQASASKGKYHGTIQLAKAYIAINDRGCTIDDGHFTIRIKADKSSYTSW